MENPPADGQPTVPPAKRARTREHPTFEQLALGLATKDALDGHVDTSDTTPVDTLAEVTCSICLQPAFGGVMTHCCEHLFHLDCLENSLLASVSQPRCPCCRRPLLWQKLTESLDVICRPLQGVLGSLRVNCSQNCGNQVRWGELRSHVLHTCVKSMFSCPHEGCGEVIPRHDLETHVAACEHGTTMCECGEEMVRRLLPSHRETTCPTHKVACQYCELFIERAKMHGHHRGECRGVAPVSLLFKTADEFDSRYQEHEENLSVFRRQLRAMRDRLGRTGFVFQLELPTTIEHLPVDDSGVFQRVFGDGWLLLLTPPQEPETPWVRVSLKHAANVVHVRLVVLRLDYTQRLLRRTWMSPQREIGADFIREGDFVPELETTVWIQIHLSDWESCESIQLR